MLEGLNGFDLLAINQVWSTTMKYLLIAFIGLLLNSTATLALEKSNQEQSNKQHKLVQELVPYNLDQTLQTFSKTVHGGVLHVVANPLAIHSR